MAYAKFTRAERENVLVLVTKYRNRGYTQHEVRQKLEDDHGVVVSQSMVAKYEKRVIERYQKLQVKLAAQTVEQKLEQLAEVRKEAWEAWERSKLDARKRTKEVTPAYDFVDSDGTLRQSEERIKIIRTVEGRLPSNQYLQTVLATIEQERAMLGLDERRAIDLNVQTVDWTELRKPVDFKDPVKAVIEAMGAAELGVQAMENRGIGATDLDKDEPPPQVEDWCHGIPDGTREDQ